MRDVVLQNSQSQNRLYLIVAETLKSLVKLIPRQRHSLLNSVFSGHSVFSGQSLVHQRRFNNQRCSPKGG